MTWLSTSETQKKRVCNVQNKNLETLEKAEANAARSGVLHSPPAAAGGPKTVSFAPAEAQAEGAVQVKRTLSWNSRSRKDRSAGHSFR